MKNLLIEAEGLNKQGESLWIERGRGSSALTIHLDIRDHIQLKKYNYIKITR